MSIKLYDGMRSDVSFDNFYKDLTDFEIEVKNKAFDLFCKLVAEKFTYYFDRGSSFNEIIDEELSGFDDINKFSVVKMHKDGTIKLPFVNFLKYFIGEYHVYMYDSDTRRPEYDFHLNLSIAYKDSVFYIIPYYEKKEYKEILNRYFRKYPYWDNDDKPDTITEREWDRRCNIWLDVLDQTFLGFHLFNKYEPVLEDTGTFIDTVVKYIPSFTERSKGLAIDRLIRNKDFKSAGEVVKYINDLKEGEIKGLDDEMRKERSSLQEIDMNVLKSYTLSYVD